MTLTTAALLRPDDGRVTSLEPAPRSSRRTFTAAYKLAILDEYDALVEPGAKGGLLRREGLYSSHLVEWRRARDSGALAGLAGRPRPAKRTSEQAELAALRRRNERLERELAKNRAALSIMGKAHELLELLSESSDTDRPSTP
jgi:transposase-like protein